MPIFVTIEIKQLLNIILTMVAPIFASQTAADL